MAEWATEAEAVGWTARTVLEGLVSTARERDREPADEVTVTDVMEALSASGSTWNRADVMRALCDIKRPEPTMSATRWADALERACDTVIEACVELDPTDPAAPRRPSDGRSMWLEPISAHVISDRILPEEDFVLSWAMQAQSAAPRASITVDTTGLDVLQAEVAAAVAGRDRLVLAVGPAGAGKTTTLRAAGADLHAQGRSVFGVAPSAKAARVLERETGVAADTLAKLLYEWQRPDRAPEVRYRLAAGATVVVDEAGMVGTSAVARLVALADVNDWRLVLVGDHRQLQAVGRGGLFQELCTTGRAIELTCIHRFSEPWEAAASLLLRRGDPRGLDAYIEHGRVIADTFDNHLDRIAATWLDTHARHGTVAVTASTNEHVDAINAAVQQARAHAGQLDDTVSVAIGGSEHAHVGDVVYTRRNDRRLITSEGEPVRNRELWTVAAVHDDGSLTVSSQLGSGTVTLDADYTRRHVRLGYAATEHGNQSDTVTIGAELATPATTRRGLYVGVTRGTDENLILVVTEHGDLDEARDVLESILASDRADIPATTQRRELAHTDRSPGRRPQPTRRCTPPDWLPDLRATIRRELDEAQRHAAHEDAQRQRLTDRLAEAKRQLVLAQQALDPRRPALDAAAAEVNAAQERLWAANSTALQTKGRAHRAAVREGKAASHDLAEAQQHQETLETVVAPVRAVISTAATKVRDIELSIHTTKLLDDWGCASDRVEQLQQLAAAVDDWQTWAAGKPMPLDRIAAMTSTLRAEADIHPAACEALATSVDYWAHTQRVELNPIQPTIESPIPVHDIGIDL